MAGAGPYVEALYAIFDLGVETPDRDYRPALVGLAAPSLTRQASPGGDPATRPAPVGMDC
jgi:hypothetical protein